MLTLAGKIPVRIHPFFWLLAIIIGWMNSQQDVLGTLLWVLVIVVSVLVHEFGHALTALVFGQQASIDLVAFGGTTQRYGKKLSLWQDFIVVLNGPLAGFLVFVVAYEIKAFYGAQAFSPIWRFLLTITINANLFWTILNLLPIHPLDGGKLLGIVLESIWGVSGIKFSLLVGMVTAIVISLACFAVGQLFLGSIVLMLAYESYRAWQGYASIRNQDRDTSLRDMVQEAEVAIRNGDSETAKHVLQQIQSTAKEGVIYDFAVKCTAEILYKEGHVKEAFERLLPLKKRLDAEGLRLLHFMAYSAREWKVGEEVGVLSYKAHPSYDTALINAFCNSQLGNAAPAVGWLSCALRDGLPNAKAVLMKADFDPIRSSTPFQKLFLSLSH